MKKMLFTLTMCTIFLSAFSGVAFAEGDINLSNTQSQQVETAIQANEILIARGYINADGVRFRAAPSTSSAILGTFNKYETVYIYNPLSGDPSNWYRVNRNGVFGYVYADYVTVTGPAKSVDE